MKPQPAAQLGILKAPNEAETVFGGRTRTWVDVAALWVHLQPGPTHAAPEAGQRPVRGETAIAAARDHPAAAAGQRLILDGPAWRVVSVQRPGGGRMTLSLDRNL